MAIKKLRQELLSLPMLFWRLTMNKEKMKTKEDLLPLNARIQVCTECSKIDVYKDDGHSCEDEEVKRFNRSMSDY